MIGAHRLEGKRVPLAKPMAVVRRVDVAPDAAADMALDGGETPATPAYHVVAVVSDKLVFKNRPQPVVADPTSTR